MKGVTVAGVAVFPHISRPSTKFDPDGIYSVKLRVTAEEAKNIIKDMHYVADSYRERLIEDAKTAQQKTKLKNMPVASFSYSEELDDNGEPNGYVLIGFKNKASGIKKTTGEKWTRAVPIFDAAGKPFSTENKVSVGPGSIIKVAYEFTPYMSPSFGIGCSNRLLAVQVIELKTSNYTAEDFGFLPSDGIDNCVPGNTESESATDF